MPQPELFETDIGNLRPNPWNTNKVSPEREEKIRTSIQRNGIFKPILVRQVPNTAGYEIIGGQHRWEQAKVLGYNEIPICNLGEIDDAQAKEIGLIDNAQYGDDDPLKLSALLQELGDEEVLTSILPIDNTDLDILFSASSYSVDDLEIDVDEDESEELVLPEQPAQKPVKTHSVMRFKVSIADAERLTNIISSTQQAHGYKNEDDLTNAGDALVHLLSSHWENSNNPEDVEDGFMDELNQAMEG